MTLGNVVLVLIILGVIVELVGMLRRAQAERAAAAAAGDAEPGEDADDGRPADDEMPPGYVIDERRADGRIVLRPVGDVESRDRENVGGKTR